MGADTAYPLPGNELTDESEVEVLNCQCDSNVVIIWDYILVIRIDINDSLLRYEAQTTYSNIVLSHSVTKAADRGGYTMYTYVLAIL